MKKKTVFILIMLALAAACFITCENPILETWWQEEDNKEEPDYDYVAIIKNMPLLIYETIIEEKKVYEYIYEEIKVYYPEYVYIEKPLPPEILLQHITIIDIEFIIFAGESESFGGNSAPYLPPAGNPGPGGSTELTADERRNNLVNVNDMADKLKSDQNYMMILHGHANPTKNPQDPQYNSEIQDLEFISTGRAEAVADVLKNEYSSINGGIPIDNKRITTRGYGGGKNLSSSTSSYAALNRRVEMILITIETDPVARQLPLPTGIEK